MATGETIYRRVRVIGHRIDAEVAASALRGRERRIMLTSSADGGRGTAQLAVGELAVCSRYPGQADAQRPADPLGEAVGLLSTADFDAAQSAAERSWFGFIGYDAARDFERLPGGRLSSQPTYELFLPEALVHMRPDRTVVVGRGTTPKLAEHAAAAAERALLDARQPLSTEPAVGTAAFNPGFEEYASMVSRAKDYIVDGDVFQVVLSLECTVPAQLDGLAAYRRLVELNPSPFQFWYRGPGFEALGCSPELCVAMQDGIALIRPLAGTRARGSDRLADQAAERELRGSEKENAEHRMLVDLARNDLGRVCRPGLVQAPRVMAVERYSHVMHLASDIIGPIAPDCGVDDVIRATFPAGTMTGAPKVRAMQIIDELEPSARGLYAGAVGCLSIDRVSLFLTIRSIVIQHGKAILRAGGGIVYDSDPLDEYHECLAKLRATAGVIDVDLGEFSDLRHR